SQPIIEEGLVHPDMAQQPWVADCVKSGFDVPFQYPLRSSATREHRRALLRSFRNPCEFGSASVSAMGSRACRYNACMALSCIVGIFTVHYPIFSTAFGIGDHHPSVSPAARPTRHAGPDQARC